MTHFNDKNTVMFLVILPDQNFKVFLRAQDL